MLLKRIGQFVVIYMIGVGTLFSVKHALGLSDYVIPSPEEYFRTAGDVFRRYVPAVLDTLYVAVLGHALSICLAALVGIIGRLNGWAGSMIRIAAYNIQAFPVVAVAPIIFILLGDGFSSRLLIAVMICYFPLLLSFIGIFSEPVEHVEHFFRFTGRLSWRLEVKIRAFENLGKLTRVIAGSATLAMVGTIVSEFIAADAGIGYSIRIALYQSDLAKILVALFLIGICVSLWLGLLEWTGDRIEMRLKNPKGALQ